MKRRKGAGVLIAVLFFLFSCRGSQAPEPTEKAESAPDTPTPVQIARVTETDVTQVVAGPGHTVALSQQKVRAPFAGTLVELRVSDGDLLRRGQIVGTIVSRESEAALSGAREMLRDAESSGPSAQRSDAERAIALAERNLVRKPLLATADGPVLSHAAAAGDRLSEDQEILTLADASSIVFVADLSQGDLPRIQPGQPAAVVLAGRATAISGRVHSVLPGANPADFSGSVRIDLPAAAERLTIGLFGTARVTVGRRNGVLVVPDAAVLRDDIRGTSQMASVVNGRNGRVHWISVLTGARQDGVTEVSGPGVASGVAVIVSGMVGLPEGKSVVVAVEPARQAK